MKTFAFIQKAAGIHSLLISFSVVGFPISLKTSLASLEIRHNDLTNAHGCQRQD